jgi:hypothetical protein
MQSLILRLQGCELHAGGANCLLSAIPDAGECEISGSVPDLGFIVKIFRSGEIVICKSLTPRREHFTVEDLPRDCRVTKCVVDCALCVLAIAAFRSHKGWTL